MGAQIFGWRFRVRVKDVDVQVEIDGFEVSMCGEQAHFLGSIIYESTIVSWFCNLANAVS